MKVSMFLCAILLAIFFVTVTASGPRGNYTNNKDDNGSQSCRSKINKNCKSSKKSCGRLGRANICTSFANDCERQLTNCPVIAAKKFYRKVNAVLCRGMPVNEPRPCGSGSKKSNKSQGTSSIIQA